MAALATRGSQLQRLVSRSVPVRYSPITGVQLLRIPFGCHVYGLGGIPRKGLEGECQTIASNSASAEARDTVALLRCNLGKPVMLSPCISESVRISKTGGPQVQALFRHCRQSKQSGSGAEVWREISASHKTSCLRIYGLLSTSHSAWPPHYWYAASSCRDSCARWCASLGAHSLSLAEVLSVNVLLRGALFSCGAGRAARRALGLLVVSSVRRLPPASPLAKCDICWRLHIMRGFIEQPI